MNAYYRLLFWLWLFSLALLGTSFLLQYGFSFVPCPLCLVNRFLVACLLVIVTLALWHRSQKRIVQWVYSASALLVALLNAGVGARHLWILSRPPAEVTSCAPSFGYLVKVLPLTEAVSTLLTSGSKACTKSDNILGLPLPIWSMVGSLLLLGGCVLSLFLARAKKVGG